MALNVVVFGLCSFMLISPFLLVFSRHFVPNLTFGAPLVKCLRKKVPDAFFGA